MQINSNNNKITVHQFIASTGLSNFSYLIELNNSCAVLVDPVATKEIEECLKKRRLVPVFIFNTHNHSDHTEGNQYFIRKYSIEVWTHPEVLKEMNIQGKPILNEYIETIEDVVFKFIYTPGHTSFDISLLVTSGDFEVIFTGDTVFNLGVGNCKNGGDVEELYESIYLLSNKLTDDTIILPGHDYLEVNIKFTVSIEGKSRRLNNLLVKRRKDGDFFTTMRDERSSNLFMRCREKVIQKNVGTDDSLQAFILLRRFKDDYR